MLRPICVMFVAAGLCHSVSAAEMTGAIEEVVVTASRIERPDFSYSNPVFSVDSETIRLSGDKNLNNLLKSIPALAGSGEHHEATGNNALEGTDGLTALNLRNLGPFRTLVLVNGRRLVGSPFPGASVADLDSLPMHLVERVEVMTGGASALYGADGVSGVVNIVMKDRFEGFDVLLQQGMSSKHDGQSRNLSASYGTSVADGRGHFSIALDYSDESRIGHNRRDFASGVDYMRFVQNPDNPNGDDPLLPDQIPLGDLRFFDYSPEGAVDVTLDALPDFNGDGTPWDEGTIAFAGPYYGQGGDGTLVANVNSDLLPDEERSALTTFFDFELSENLSFVSELSYTKADSYSVGTPSYDYVLVMWPEGPFVPDAIENAAQGLPLLVNRDHFDFGKRRTRTDRETLRAVAGLEGRISDSLEFEISYSYGETEVEETSLNNRYNDRFAAALDATVDPSTGEVVCASELDPAQEPFNLSFQEWNDYEPQPGTWAGSFVPGMGDCVPINIFGHGSPSQEALNWIHTDSVNRANLKQQIVQGFVRGTTDSWLRLPAGPVGFVAGVEWRKEEVAVDRARENELGYTFANKYVGERGDQTVTEMFGELDVPLLEEHAFARYLALDGAIRYSDYSETEAATTWKVGLVWQPVESLTVRATVAEATRSPSIQELYTPDGTTFESISDPCDINNLPNGSANRMVNCAATLSALGIDPATFVATGGANIAGTVGGNRKLKQETADTFTWGLIFTPSFIEGLTMSLDWYDIELKDAIEYSLPQQVAELCVDLPSPNQFCDLIGRDPTSGAIDDFKMQPNNVARLETRGVDFTISYLLDPARWGGSPGWGTFALNLSGNRLDDLDKTSLPGVEPVSEVGLTFRPEWQANLDIEWRKGSAIIGWRMEYFDETDRFDRITRRNNPNISAPRYFHYDRKLTHDIRGSFDFSNQISVYGGINNLTDEKPDVAELSYPVGPLGRYMFIGLNWRL